MTIFLALVAVLSLLAGALGVSYGRAQARIAAAMKAKLDDQERDINEWLVKHENVALRIAKINPNQSVMDPSHSYSMILYTTIFPDAKFREMIERYIVHVEKSGTVFSPRSPTDLGLRSNAFRETVTKATEMLDAFCKEHPAIRI
jgi:hypothetical protein